MKNLNIELNSLKKDQQEKIFEPDGLITKAIATLLIYPQLVSQIESTEWISELSRPEAFLFLEIMEYFKLHPEGRIADLLSNLDSESASYVGSLISSYPLIEEKNSVVYFQDCMEAMKKSNPTKRIEELKKVLSKEDLSEDQAFELQQHLLSKLEHLNHEDRELLKNLSKR